MTRRGDTMDWTQIINVGIAAIIGAIAGAITMIMGARGLYRKQIAEADALTARAKSDLEKALADTEAVKTKTTTDKRSADIEAMSVVLDRLLVSYQRLSDQSAEDIKDLEGRITKLEGERDSYIEGIRIAQREVTEANQRIAELAAQVEQLGAELVRANQRITELEAEVARKNAELDLKNREIEDYQRRLTITITALEQARKENGKL